MQIAKMILYNEFGKKRELSFKLGSLNIITGKSKSGKSAVGEIIEYCLGSNKCNIADGVIREKVSWYGLLLQFNQFQLFIARKNPVENKNKSDLFYFREGENVAIPSLDEIRPNANLDAILEKLGSLSNISENHYTDSSNQINKSVKSNFTAALKFCFQDQDEIAAKNILFHNQAQPFVQNTIKDTLPYFLGASTEDAAILIRKKKGLQKQLKKLQAEYEEYRGISNYSPSLVNNLIEEAQDVGLLDKTQVKKLKDNNNRTEIIKNLSSLNTNNLTEYMGDERLLSLQKEIAHQQDILSRYNSRIQEVEIYQKNFQNFHDELGYKSSRLKSIGLFKSLNFRTNYCPFCSNKLSNPLPNLDEMKKSLLELNDSIEKVDLEQPKLDAYLMDLKEKRNETRSNISTLRLRINDAYDQQKYALKNRDIYLQQSKVLGRISLWLESQHAEKDKIDFSGKINDLGREIDMIDSKLNESFNKDQVEYALSKIQANMNNWTQTLDLEYENSTYRFDLNKMTVIVDKDRPIPLSQLGSGANWLGVHLITYFAFQKFFIQHNRPVPAFLFLDQPSQVYFPVTMRELQPGSEDYKAVENIYAFINDRVNEENGKLQVIVVDHACLQNKIFDESVIENWHKVDDNLIPSDWLE